MWHSLRVMIKIKFCQVVTILYQCCVIVPQLSKWMIANTLNLCIKNLNFTHPFVRAAIGEGGLAISTRKASHINLQVSCISNSIHMTPGEFFSSIFTLSIKQCPGISDLQWNISKGLTPWCNANQAVLLPVLNELDGNYFFGIVYTTIKADNDN